MAKRNLPAPHPNPIGRPDKFTPERRQAILESISKHIPYELAAQANGIAERTLYYWLERGELDDEKGISSDYVDFLQAIKNVEQEKINEHINCIKDKPERWQANAWLLERRWWQYFSPNAAVIEFNKKLERLERQGGKNNVKTLKSEAKEITEK